MTMLVIDVSRNSIQRSFSDKGVAGILHYVLRFRIFRSVLVISIWGPLGLCVGYSISSISPSGLPFEQLRMCGSIIAGMSNVLVVWMILSRLDRAVRHKIACTPAVPTASTGAAVRTSCEALRGQRQPAWQHPRNACLLVVDHDNDGDVTHVRSWQEWAGRPASAGTATPPTPFTHSPEYNPDKPMLDSHPAGETIVLETLDRVEPSLAGSDTPAQPPRDIAKAVDAITANVTGFHRFDCRGRLGRGDWVEPTSRESAAQTHAMCPGMTRYYGSITAVVHGRAAVQAADHMTEHHHTWRAFGARAQVEDPCIRLQRIEHIDPLYGFGRCGNTVASDA